MKKSICLYVLFSIIGIYAGNELVLPPQPLSMNHLTPDQIAKILVERNSSYACQCLQCGISVVNFLKNIYDASQAATAIVQTIGRQFIPGPVKIKKD